MFKNTMKNITTEQSQLFLFFVLMIALLVLNNELLKYSVNIANVKISLNFLIYPITFLLADLTFKHHQENKTALIIFFSTFIFFAYYLFESFLLIGQQFELEFALANVATFFVSQTLNLIIVSKLLNNNQFTMLNSILALIIVLSFDCALKMISINTLFYFTDHIFIYFVNNLCQILVAILLLFSYHFYLKKHIFKDL